MKNVLIVTYSGDNECVNMVEEALKKRNARSFRFDTDLFPTGIQLDLEESSGDKRWIYNSPRGELDLTQLTGAWYRRMRIAEKIPMTMDKNLRYPSVQESHAVITGMLESLDTFIIDGYSRVKYASNKQLQLKIARQVGLEIPRTLITNNPEAVRRFFTLCGNDMITKMMSSFAVYEGKKEKVVYTNVIKPGDLDDLDGLSLCPMTFQENIKKRLELRVTVVGNHIFAAAIDSQKSDLASNDWRRDGLGLINDWEPYSLPEDVQTKLLELMDAFKLNYGAVDFIVTPDNRHIFLEINPAGEFFWLELYKPHFPISNAIADVLVGDSFRR